MIITHVSDGVKSKYRLRGTELTVGEVTIDLAERQGSVGRVVDICLDQQLKTMREGLGAWYVATIIIPAKQQELVPSGEKDEEGYDIMVERDRPLDTNQVELRLWGLPEGYGEKVETVEEGVTE